MFTRNTKKQVTKAQAKVKSALTMFSKAHAELTQSVEQLHKAQREDEKKIQDLRENQNLAQEHIDANYHVMEKLAELIPAKK